MLQKRREPVFHYWFPLFVFIIYISFTSQKPWNWSTISRKLPWPRHHPAGTPAATAQRCAGAIPGITAGNVHHRLRDATGDRPLVSSPLGGILAHPITRTYTRVRNGKQYTYHQTDWVADVCAHQFHHEYVAGAPNEIAMQAGGPCKSKNDPRSVPALESKYDRQCRKADQWAFKTINIKKQGGKLETFSPLF